MILPCKVTEEVFEKINKVTNIMYQSERKTFEDCELVIQQVIDFLYKEGMLKLKEDI